MVAKRPPAEDDFSLFSFMDIITIVVGVLMLMIAALSFEQMDNQDVALIEAYETAEAKIQEEIRAQAEIQKLIDEKLGKTAALTRLQIEASEKELERIQKQIANLEQELEKLKAAKIVIPTISAAMREKTSEMQAELVSLEEQLAQLEKDITSRKDAPPANVSVLPSGSGLNFIPHFVECQDGALVLHDMNPPKTIRAANMVTDKDFLKVLEDAANNASNSIVFLIRSDGLNTFNAAQKLCRDRDIPNGKLPIVGQGKVDLSYFNKKK